MRLATQLLAAPDPAAARRLIAAAPQDALRAAFEQVADEVARRFRDDPNRALEAAELATVMADATGDSRDHARAIWVRGHALAGTLRNDEALSCYEAAAAAYTALGDALAAARTAIGQVTTLIYLRRFREALTIGEAARRVLIRHRQPAAAARLDMNLGNIYLRLERPDRALRLYDRALRVARRLRDAKMAQHIQFNRGNILISLGKLDHAERVFRAVQHHARRDGERWFDAYVDYNLGYIYLQRGDYDRAFDTLDAARGVFEGLGHDQTHLLTLLDLTELLVEMNSFRRARAMGRRARTKAERLGMSFEAGSAMLFMGIAALGLGQELEADALLQAAASSFTEDGHTLSAALCEVYMAELDSRRGEHATAGNRLERAARAFARQKNVLRETTARVKQAATELTRGRTERARAVLAAARRLVRRVPSPWLRAQIDHLDGRLAEQTGRPGRALSRFRSAVERIESIRGRIGIDEFRISFAEDKAPIYADLIELILERGGPRAVRDAFAVVERSRSRALVDLLAGRLSAATVAADPRTAALVEKMERLRAQINWLSGYDPEGGTGRRDERRMARHARLIRRREAEVADLMQRVARSDLSFGALAGSETVTLGDVQDTLEADTTLVEYYLGRGRARAFIIRRDGARVVDLPLASDEVTASLSRLRFQIEKWAYGDDYVHAREPIVREAIDHHLRALAERLWDPLAVPDGRVVVVPHGPLHSLPFHALRLASGEHVIDRHVLTYLPSASARRYLGNGGAGDHAATSHRDPGGRPGRADEVNVLAVGIEDADIPEVAREIREVRRLFRRGRTLRGGRATRRRFMSAAPSADLIHIAAHAVFREDDPHFSSLRFADGWMSLYDVYQLRTRAALVCISACQSGRSWVSAGDEMVGLARGFLFAGATSLVVSLWPVQDASTAELMTLFYSGLRSGIAAEVALRAAMLELRDIHPHAYHWAPFVLVGKTGVRLSAPAAA